MYSPAVWRMSTFVQALMKTSPKIFVVVDAIVALMVVPVPGKILKKLAVVRATEATPRTAAKAVAMALGSTLNPMMVLTWPSILICSALKGMESASGIGVAAINAALLILTFTDRLASAILSSSDTR